MSKLQETVADLKSQIGTELGVTDWFSVSQKDADLFSALTDDWDYMHNDPNWAADSQWGGTIAHGMYMMSLIPSFLKRTTNLPIISDNPDHGLGVNYGFDKVRFIKPMPIDAPHRAHVSLLDVVKKTDTDYLLKTETRVFSKDDPDKPAMIAENLVYMIGD